MSSLTLAPLDPGYPARLLALRTPPPLTLSRPLAPAVAVAVVGTRAPTPEARRFAAELGARIASRGGIVVSGGAVGVDAAAHEGALARRGLTFCVVGTGRGRVFPAEHQALYERIAASEGAMIWPFKDGTPVRPGHFPRRNGVLVALSDAVVVVQAGKGSGALNAAGWARRLGRPLWVVPQAPWASEGFEGSLGELERGMRPYTSHARFLEAVGLGEGAPLPLPLVPHHLKVDPFMEVLLQIMGARPLHVDELSETSGLGISVVCSALLTLALENVVEEGPSGFFRLASQ